jgi:hypothetical protein
MLVKNAISHYLDNYISLSKKDISASAKSREWFLTRIENVINARSGEPKLYSGKFGDKFVYFGSYFKGTKVADVDEYDVLLLIDSNSGIYSKSGMRIGIGQGSADPNPKYYRKYYKDDGSGVSPSKMLNWLKSVVDEVVETFDGEAPIRDGQAITATIKSQDLKIDLVPAGVFVNDSGKLFYNIPDGTAANSWITTSPELDIAELDRLAKDRKNFKNVIRLLKRIRDTYNLQLSSFPIEMSTVQHVYSNSWYHDLYRDTTGAIRTLTSTFRSGIMSDKFNDDQNLLEGLENLDWYADRLDTIADKLDSYHTKLSDEEEVKSKVISLFENES